MVEPDNPQMTLRCMRFACWITEATDTHSEYVIQFIVIQDNNGFENTSSCYVYTYISCLLLYNHMEYVNIFCAKIHGIRPLNQVLNIGTIVI
jgi:hypothetical protein